MPRNCPATRQALKDCKCSLAGLSREVLADRELENFPNYFDERHDMPESCFSAACAEVLGPTQVQLGCTPGARDPEER